LDSDNGDYHLKPISPVTDQGTATDDPPVDDIDSNARPAGSDYDMGIVTRRRRRIIKA